MVSPLAQALTFQQPIMQPARQPMATTDVTTAYRDAQNAAMLKYQAQLQQQNALWGGLAGLGSAGILGGPRLYQMIKGAGATAPATTAAEGVAPALGTGADTLTGAADLTGLGTAAADVGLGTTGADIASAVAPAAADAGSAGLGSFLLSLLPFA